MVGRNLYDNSTLQMALSALEREVNPDNFLPDATAEFRKRLAIDLFYKFILNTIPAEVPLDPKHRSGGSLLHRPLSSGRQTFDTQPNNYPLTQPVIKLDALMQTSGEALYQNDIRYRDDDDLWCAFVLATQIDARILQIDTTQAMVR